MVLRKVLGGELTREPQNSIAMSLILCYVCSFYVDQEDNSLQDLCKLQTASPLSRSNSFANNFGRSSVPIDRYGYLVVKDRLGSYCPSCFFRLRR
jgi:hypothetical protein